MYSSPRTNTLTHSLPADKDIGSRHTEANSTRPVDEKQQGDYPLFGARQNHETIMCQDTVVEPLLNPRILQGFFKQEYGNWLCHVERDFDIELSYTLRPWIVNERLDLIDAKSRARTQIKDIAVTVSVSSVRPPGEPVELRRRVLRCDKDGVLPKQMVRLRPMPPEQAWNNGGDANHSKLYSNTIGVGPQLPLQNNLGKHRSANEDVLKRIRFNCLISPNHGEVGIQSQYFQLNVGLWARISPDGVPMWVKTAEVSTSPLLVLREDSPQVNLQKTILSVETEPAMIEGGKAQTVDLRSHVKTTSDPKTPLNHTGLDEDLGSPPQTFVDSGSDHDQTGITMGSPKSHAKGSSSQLLHLIRNLRNALAWIWRPRLSPGFARVSWTCMCGKPLYADAEKSRVAHLVEFAKEAAGPSNVDTVSVGFARGDSPTSSQTLSSDESNHTFDTQGTPPSSMSSDHGHTLSWPIPDDQERYILLCVNTGIHRIDLAHVDVKPGFPFGTPTPRDDRYLFEIIKSQYFNLRKNSPTRYFVKPKTVHFVKFELIHRQLSGACVGNFEKNKIPSKGEAIEFGYHFSPCPPAICNIPVMPHIFMHSFLEPGDHTGSLIVNRLPKKVGKRLLPGDWPGYGWGIHIIEGYNWKLLRGCVLAFLATITIFALLWGILRGDVQGGFGIGQYLVGLLALAISAYVVEESC